MDTLAIPRCLFTPGGLLAAAERAAAVAEEYSTRSAAQYEQWTAVAKAFADAAREAVERRARG